MYYIYIYIWSTEIALLIFSKSFKGFLWNVKVFTQFLTLYNYNNIVHLLSLSSFPSRTVVLGYCYACFHLFTLIWKASQNLNCQWSKRCLSKFYFVPPPKTWFRMFCRILPHVCCLKNFTYPLVTCWICNIHIRSILTQTQASCRFNL